MKLNPANNPNVTIGEGRNAATEPWVHQQRAVAASPTASRYTHKHTDTEAQSERARVELSSRRSDQGSRTPTQREREREIQGNSASWRFIRYTVTARDAFALKKKVSDPLLLLERRRYGAFGRASSCRAGAAPNYCALARAAPPRPSPPPRRRCYSLASSARVRVLLQE